MHAMTKPQVAWRRRAEPITGQDGKRQGGGGARLGASAKWTGAKQRAKELAARRETGASLLWANCETGAPWAGQGAPVSQSRGHAQGAGPW